jgi:hypothetical protein
MIRTRTRTIADLGGLNAPSTTILPYPIKTI